MSVIAISRGSLSAAVELAKGLNAKLGGKIVTREQVIEAAERYGIQETGLSEKHIIAQQPPGFWERYSDARRHYLTCFKAALLDFVLQESIIYHGNLAHILLQDIPFVLRIRVNAPFENRIKALMDTEGISEDIAAQKVREIDQRRKRWTQFLYDADYKDPVLFDLVLNMERMTIQDGIELVVSEVKKDQFQPNEESLKIVKDIRLATIAQIHLMHSTNTYSLELKVEADAAAGEVVVYKSPALEVSATTDSDIRAALADVEEIKTVTIKDQGKKH